MNKQLEDAIRLIEEAGGFVMFQGDIEDHDTPLTEAQIEAMEVENRKAVDDYLERKNEAFRRFDKLLGSKNFSYGKVEDICFEEGIDMDEIENWIHSQY